MKPRPGLNKKKVLITTVAFLLLLTLAIILIGHRDSHKTSQKIQVPVSLEKAPTAAPVIEELIIPHGKTITDILVPFGFSAARVIEIRNSVKSTYDLARIPAGQKLRLIKDNGQYTKLQMDLDAERYLEIDLKEDQPQASIRSYPITRTLILVEGVITDSLIAAVNEAGEQDLLALMLSEIFGWNIDFYIDLRKGDAFRLLVEKKYVNGQFSSYGPILAAWFLNKNQTFEAYRFEYPDSTKFDYFDAEGNSLRREFLKSPLRYARITSRFSHSRFHPIRKIYRPHYGVDYAAPVGTPVQATAPGIVIFAGWNGGAGRMVRIRHSNAYESMYLHLRSLAAAIRTGARVEGGQVIGYVGSTGESTGPHLDYRLLHHGGYINPLNWRFQPAEPLPREYLPDFSVRVKVLKMLLSFPLAFF